MNEFDPSKPFTCRDKRYKAEILRMGLQSDFPIAVLITYPNGQQAVESLMTNGRAYLGCASPFDLVNVPGSESKPGPGRRAYAVIDVYGVGFIHVDHHVALKCMDNPGNTIFPIDVPEPGTKVL